MNSLDVEKAFQMRNIQEVFFITDLNFPRPQDYVSTLF